MQHCCKFKPEEIYYLKDNDNFSSRILSIGFCPICSKPVAELKEWRFDGKLFLEKAVGIKANDLMINCKDEINYSMRDLNYKKFKSKPFAWKYGINKTNHNNGKTIIMQYACDFYGNKELVKKYNS